MILMFFSFKQEQEEPRVSSISEVAMVQYFLLLLVDLSLHTLMYVSIWLKLNIDLCSTDTLD